MEVTENNREFEFMKNGPWTELYALMEHWKSDLEFYRDDLRFLHHLIDKYFVWIAKSENLETVRELKSGLLQLKMRVRDLLEKVCRHKAKLAQMAEDPNKIDAAIIRTEHEHLEEEMVQFVRLFRANRKKVFAITEFIMDSEELSSKLDT